MTIEDECTGFVLPASRQNVAMNEWGLAKTMCKCSGIPSWSRRTPPRCRICQRKRAERRAKKEEDIQKIKHATEEVSEMGDGSSNIVVKVTAAGDGDNREGRSSEEMQIDEKGSGDMWATEKIVEEIVKEDSESLCHKNLMRTEPESREGSGDMKEDEKRALENVSETNKLKDAKEKASVDSDNNVVIEKRGKMDLVANKIEVKQTVSEVKQKLPLASDISTAGETNGSGYTSTSRKVVGDTSLETSKLNKGNISLSNSNSSSNETKQMDGNGDKRTPSEASKLRDTKQKVSPGISSIGPKQTKVKVANKYKTNVKVSQEAAAEV
jgi:hypothetical protein